MASKDKILEFLESNKHTYISGEAMAATLGLSRNAIWKAINDLRKAGYEIEAVRNKGYRLAAGSDIISIQGILAHLLNPAMVHPENIHIFEELDSTNKKAKELAIAGNEHGTLVLAKSQTLGKGRRDHNFYSPKGGIYMSVLLSPEKIPTLDKDALTTYTGNAVCDAIEELCDVRPRIKPLNDLFIENRKICGILTESGIEYETDLVQWLVIGIGINFDSDVSKFPRDLQDIVGSLYAPGQAEITKNQLIARIYEKLLAWSKS